MPPKPTWTQEQLERTPWAQEFHADSPVSYATAIKYALTPNLRVAIEKSTEAFISQWVICVFEDPSFWMDAKPTKKAAVMLCREMGWRIAS